MFTQLPSIRIRIWIRALDIAQSVRRQKSIKYFSAAACASRRCHWIGQRCIMMLFRWPTERRSMGLNWPYSDIQKCGWYVGESRREIT